MISLIVGALVGAILIVGAFHVLTTQEYPGVTVHLVGDSTMSEKLASKRPETGWGEPFATMLCDGARMVNHAKNGRSTKSFLSEGLWEDLLAQLRKGDLVLIQFGHNDQKADEPRLFTNAWQDYKKNLQGLVNDTRAKGAEPVLLTSIVRRAFDSSGKLRSTLGDYPAATRQLAKEMSVQLVDLNTMTHQLIETMGPEASRAMFLHLPPGVNANYIEGKQDNSHLSAQGALNVATMTAIDLKAFLPDVICH